MRICAIIPAYNEAARIAPVITRTLPHVDTVLVVDDGSKDDTIKVSEAAGATVLRHTVNQGKGMALRNGLDWGCDKGFTHLLTLDADGQHLPEEIPPFIVAALTGADLVVGNRMTDIETMPWVRKQTNLFMSWMVGKLATCAVPDSQCGFRLISAETWSAVNPTIKTVGFDFESEILIQAGRMGFVVEAVKVSTVYGDEKSKIRPCRDTIRFFRMVFRKLVEKRPARVKR